jgi:hypothetical protein
MMTKQGFAEALADYRTDLFFLKHEQSKVKPTLIADVTVAWKFQGVQFAGETFQQQAQVELPCTFAAFFDALRIKCSCCPCLIPQEDIERMTITLKHDGFDQGETIFDDMTPQRHRNMNDRPFKKDVLPKLMDLGDERSIVVEFLIFPDEDESDYEDGGEDYE